MPSLLIDALTAETGMCTVTSPTLSRSLHIIISGSPLNSEAKNSVWPVKRNASPCTFSLQIGPVTTASIVPAFRSVAAAFSAATEAAPAAGVISPGSTRNSSEQQLTRLTRFGLASAADPTMLKLRFSAPSICFL